jgi:hypothetical protein
MSHNTQHLLDLVRKLFKEAPSEVLPVPNSGQQCISYNVIVFNGMPSELTLDKSARILYLVSRGTTLFSVSLRMSYGLGLIRHKFPQGSARRQLLLRSEPNRTATRFKTASLMQFETMEDLERLTSDVYRGSGAVNLSGMQTATVRLAIIHWNVGATNPSTKLQPLVSCVDDETNLVAVSASQCVFQSPGAP